MIRGTCNYEMTNTSNTLQRVNQTTFEICVTHFVVACSPEDDQASHPLQTANDLKKSDFGCHSVVQWRFGRPHDVV